jgi:hypothetical protein
MEALAKSSFALTDVPPFSLKLSVHTDALLTHKDI